LFTTLVHIFTNQGVRSMTWLDAEDKDESLLSEGIGEAKIVVVGAGGAGNNTIDRLAMMGVRGAQLISVNTDKQHLTARQSDKKILIGFEITKGLGAGGKPQVGEQSALEAKPALKELMSDADLVFLTCGLGGGTGTGSLPVIAEIAKSCDAVVVGAVTMPFKLERARISKAKAALEKLRKHADTVIVVDNNKLLSLVPDVPMNEAFAVADEVMAKMVKGITETISTSSLINLDFADVRTVMTNEHKRGIAMIGLGESDTSNRAQEAVQNALDNPLLDVDYRGATGALVHIKGGEDLTLAEAEEIGQIATSYLREDANVIWGARILPEYNGKVEVMVIMTGVQSNDIVGPTEEITVPKRDIQRRFIQQPHTSQFASRQPARQPDDDSERAPKGIIAGRGIDYIL